MREGTTIWITTESKAALDRLKVIPQEPYHQVVERLLKYWKDTHGLIKRETSGVEKRKRVVVTKQ